jgi:hypothetical protein
MNENIAKALVKAQKEFGPALKSATNPHFRSKYADLSACVEAVIDALNANGVMLLQKNHPSEHGVSVETVFLHESGEEYSAGVLNVPATKLDAQGYGSALTYARRYSLMAACGIAPEDDDGNAASKKPEAKPTTKPASIQNTEAPKPEFSKERLVAIDVATNSAIEAYGEGRIDAAHDFVYGVESNEEVAEIWSRIGKYSGMRKAIKDYRDANVTNQQQKEAA